MTRWLVPAIITRLAREFSSIIHRQGDSGPYTDSSSGGFRLYNWAERPQIDVRKAVIQCKEESRCSKCCHPADMPIIPEQAMEFLSRTWSPSSSDFFQTLRTSSEHRQPEKAIKDEEGNEEKDEERHLSTVNFSGGKSQFFNQTWRKKRKEELRLHAAQARAAVSVAQLAAAIAGIVSVCELRPDNLKYVEAADSKKMGTVLASAAALVATVCAEAAELAGTNRSGVTSAVKTGVESCSSAELLTLTATAATCLRGAAALKLRADVRGIGSNNSVGTSTTSIHKDTTLRVRLPCGSVRLRKVAVFPQCDRVVLRLGKKHLHGAFSTYKNYEVLDVSSNGGDVVVDGMVLFPLVLRTAAGVVQLLLDSQMHCKVWKNAIEGILSDQNVKHAKL
uniref:VAN3-binding protein-like auxin canalisation domain-containing protein n=1 Tax=Oryza glumipatula TaxID=40148 RepID=A0A0E0BDZ6_9ORYZ